MPRPKAAKTMNDAEWEKISKLLIEYNQYVEGRIKQIMDFDIWFENSKGIEFPKEWYTIIRDSNANK